MTDRKREPDLTPILVGLKRSGKSDAGGALFETRMARYFPWIIFDQPNPVEQYLKESEGQEERNRIADEARWPSADLRERLLARRAEREVNA